MRKREKKALKNVSPQMPFLIPSPRKRLITYTTIHNNVIISIRIATILNNTHSTDIGGVTPGVTRVTHRVSQSSIHLITTRTLLLSLLLLPLLLLLLLLLLLYPFP